jgi:putative tryptophan/tyrosine transport system substrate-binding protein
MHFDQVKRREFIPLIGGAAITFPVAARAQQGTIPVIGYLGPNSAVANAQNLQVMRRGLAEAGFVEGRTVAIEYHYADGQYDRLPAMAAELVRRNVAMIVATGGTAPALAAKAARATIPIVFSTTDDPVALGLVESFARPGGNATGVNFPLAELGAKQLSLLHEIVPSAARVGLLVNPRNTVTETVTREVAAAASAMGIQIDVAAAGDSPAIEAAFSTFVRNRVEAVLVGSDPYFFGRRVQLTTLATRHALPAIYNVREFTDVGGLMSYGTSLTEVFRQVAAYAARILKGAKAADLPVVRSVTFELVINLPTARALGLEVPATLLARADEVIE